MEEYEKNSYRNIFHNYKMMKHIGLDPIKPQFMTRGHSKRSSSTAVCLPPAKLPRQLFSPPSLTQFPEGEGHSETFNLSPVGNTKTIKLIGDILKVDKPYHQYSLLGKMSVLSVSRQELMCGRQLVTARVDQLLDKLSLCGRAKHLLSLQTNGSAAPLYQQAKPTGEDKLLSLQTYGSAALLYQHAKPTGEDKLFSLQTDGSATPRLHQHNKSTSAEKLLSLQTNGSAALFHQHNKPSSDDKLLSLRTDGSATPPLHQDDKATSKDKLLSLQTDGSAAPPLHQGDKPTSVDKENKATLHKALVPIKTKILPKRPVRTVQTQTVTDMKVIDTEALVFYNRATCVRLSAPLPPPPQLDRKAKVRVQQWRKMNTRSIVTQTAREGESIKEAYLVFTLAKKSRNVKTEKGNDIENKSARKCTDVDRTQVVNSMCKNETQKSETLADNDDISFGFTDEENSNDGSNRKESVACKSTVDVDDDFDFSSPDCSANDGSNKKESVECKSTVDVDDDFDFSSPDCSANNTCNKKESVTGKSAVDVDDDFDFSSPDCSGVGEIEKEKKRAANKPPNLKPNSILKKNLLGSGTDTLNSSHLIELSLEKSNGTILSSFENNTKTLEDAETETADKPKRRYPRRNIPTQNYTEAEILQDDEYLFCDACDREYEGDCPEHGPQKHFVDTFAPITGKDDRALLTTPAMLEVNTSKIPGGGSGVWTVYGLPPHVRLGPYQGEKSQHPDSEGYSWTIMKDRKVSHYMTAPSKASSNWMRFVNCARHQSEQNLMAFQYKGEMYYRTVKSIPPKMELFVWYGKEYAEKLGISLESFRQADKSHITNVTFPCESCGMNFTSPLYLKNHKKVCRKGRQGGLVKVGADEMPTELNSLATVCDGKKVYCCHLCAYKTTNSGRMKYHLAAHCNVKSHVCNVCGKGFTQAGSLVMHKRIHSGEKQFKCTECSYSCNQASNLKTHMTTHTGEKIYSCSQCEFTTTQSGHLKDHTRTHTGERPYTCTHCEYRTTQSSALTTHVKSKHSTERPHTCPHCHYKAAVRSTLNHHIKTKHLSQ